MGLFTGIMSKIFGHGTPAATPQALAATPPLQASTPASPSPAEGNPPPSASFCPVPAFAPAVESPPPTPAVDVAAVLDDLATHNQEKLDWRKSIVDLMKLVGVDSNLASRKELALELEYPGDPGDSAKMNVWLHKEVINYSPPTAEPSRPIFSIESHANQTP